MFGRSWGVKVLLQSYSQPTRQILPGIAPFVIFCVEDSQAQLSAIAVTMPRTITSQERSVPMRRLGPASVSEDVCACQASLHTAKPHNFNSYLSQMRLGKSRFQGDMGLKHRDRIDHAPDERPTSRINQCRVSSRM
jgi:hypothetical protein